MQPRVQRAILRHLIRKIIQLMLMKLAKQKTPGSVRRSKCERSSRKVQLTSSKVGLRSRIARLEVRPQPSLPRTITTIVTWSHLKRVTPKAMVARTPSILRKFSSILSKLKRPSK